MVKIILNNNFLLIKIIIGDIMAITKLINENEENIKSAVAEGISGDAVGTTLEDIVDVVDSKGKTPQQVRDTVEAIVEMKINPSGEHKYPYESCDSHFVEINGDKLIAAIEDGINSKEVATTLVNSTNNSNTKKGRKHLKFIVNLISKMKRKELRLKKNKENVQEKNYQKVLK